LLKQHPLHSAHSIPPTPQDYNQQFPVLKTICSKAQSTLLTMGVKTPETCWDIIEGISHYLLHLVGLVMIHLSKMHGQKNIKFKHTLSFVYTQ
jgi:hypothetical protein